MASAIENVFLKTNVIFLAGGNVLSFFFISENFFNEKDILIEFLLVEIVESVVVL